MELEIAICIVGLLIFIVGIVSCITSIWLAVRYSRYNKTENTAGMSGQDVARKILDDHGLDHIKVSTTGSIMFGNSYSHYFKKIRLRRMTRHENSITSLGMGAQKAALAVLAKEGDPDMKRQIRLVPLVTFGPFAFIPLILVGAALDYYVFHQTAACTMVLGGLGLAFYVYSIILSITMLKTEKKAQVLANTILLEEGLINAEESEMLIKLFHLYNVQYVNDIILSCLELIYNVLKLIAMFKGGNDN